MITSAPASFRALFARLATILAIVALANVALGALLDAARDRCAKREPGVIVNARAAVPEVLILGSSRVKYHYDDALLTKLWRVRVFNAGAEGMGLPFSRVVFEQVTRRHRPRVVIIDVMAFKQDFERVHTLDPWYRESPVLRSLPAAEPGVAAWKTDWLMRIPTRRYAGQSWDVARGAFAKISETGFSGLDGPGPAISAGIRSTAAPESHLIPQLDALVRECRAAGAEVILCVSAPIAAGFDAELVSPVSEYAVRNGVPLVKFDTTVFPEVTLPGVMRDEGHLTRRGAELFTRRVAAELPRISVFLSSRNAS